MKLSTKTNWPGLRRTVSSPVTARRPTPLGPITRGVGKGVFSCAVVDPSGVVDYVGDEYADYDTSWTGLGSGDSFDFWGEQK
jgi:hypothetical protein